MDRSNAPNSYPLVLLVEDDDASRQACAAILRTKFCVLTAASFKEAVHKMLSPAPLQAVLTDYHLPDGSGLEVRKLAHLKEIPVLLISGDQTLGRSYQPFLGKPFSAEQLHAASEELLLANRSALSRSTALGNKPYILQKS